MRFCGLLKHNGWRYMLHTMLVRQIVGILCIITEYTCFSQMNYVNNIPGDSLVQYKEMTSCVCGHLCVRVCMCGQKCAQKCVCTGVCACSLVPR